MLGVSQSLHCSLADRKSGSEFGGNDCGYNHEFRAIRSTSGYRNVPLLLHVACQGGTLCVFGPSSMLQPGLFRL